VSHRGTLRARSRRARSPPRPRGAVAVAAAAAAGAAAVVSQAPISPAGRAIQSDLTAASDPRLILDIVANHADGFDAIHAATAMHRLATHARSQRDRESATRDARFAILLDVVTRSLRKMNSQGLANVAWACARLEHHPGEDVPSRNRGGARG
jgi:hypothetical protein